MRAAAISVVVLLGFAQAASAYCKFQGADGKWYYGDNCREMSGKEIEQEAAAVLKRRNEYGTGNRGVVPRRLQGYEYGDPSYGERRVDAGRDRSAGARPR